MKGHCMFVAVKFNPQYDRSYTYFYNGAAALSPGDMVKVETKDGIKTAHVEAINVSKPPFTCKPIASVISDRQV